MKLYIVEMKNKDGNLTCGVGVAPPAEGGNQTLLKVVDSMDEVREYWDKWCVEKYGYTGFTIRVDGAAKPIEIPVVRVPFSSFKDSPIYEMVSDEIERKLKEDQ